MLVCYLTCCLALLTCLIFFGFLFIVSFQFIVATLVMSVEDRSWMYHGWKDNGCHSEEWVRNTNAFLDHVFCSAPNAANTRVVCPCSDCRNRVRRRRGVMSMHLCKRGFMLGYTRWTEHGEHSITVSKHIIPLMAQMKCWPTLVTQ